MGKTDILEISNEKIQIWDKFTLGEIAEYLNGRAFKPKEWEDTGLPIIRIQNLNDPDASYNYTTENFKDKYKVTKSDLLFAWSASLDAYIWKGGEAWLNQHIFKVVSKDFVNKHFLYYYLKRIIRDLYAKSHGSGMVHVTKKKFENTEIFIPPLPIQHRIVEKIEELFSDLDNGVENLQKAQQQLESYKQAVLKAAFEGKLTKEWREQQDGLPTPEELKQQIEQERKKYREQQLEEWEQDVKHWEEDGRPGKKPRKPRKLSDLKDIEEDELENLDKVPPSWLLLRTQEIGEWNGGGTPRRSNNEYWNDGTIPWVSPKDMKRKNIFTTQDLMTEKALSESSSAKMVDKGSVLFVTRSGILRRTLPVAIAKNDLTINQDLKALTPLVDLSPEYIYWYCEANNFRIRRKCSKDGTTVESIKTQAIKNYPIPICSPLEQKQLIKEIESKTSIIQQLTTTIEEELQKAESLRQSILKKAFEGKLVSETISEPEFQKPLQRYYKNTATDLHAGLMAKIINLHYENDQYLNRLNHVKCEKIIHMLESHVGIDLQRKPVKDAAGPDDYNRLKKVEHRANMKNWFAIDESIGGDLGYGYKPKGSLDFAITSLNQFKELPLQRIDDMINLFLPMDKERAEVVATLYAAWNNFLIGDKKPTDEEIVHAAREDWSKEKLKIKRSNFVKALNWMKKKKLIPAGFGKLVEEKI